MTHGATMPLSSAVWTEIISYCNTIPAHGCPSLHLCDVARTVVSTIIPPTPISPTQPCHSNVAAEGSASFLRASAQRVFFQHLLGFGMENVHRSYKVRKSLKPTEYHYLLMHRNLFYTDLDK